MGVRGGLIVDFLNGICLQLLAAVLALLMTAPLGADGGLLIHDPLAGGVAGGLGVVLLIAVAATGAGEQGEAHRRTGGGGHFRPVVVAQRLCNDGPALGTKLGLGAGGRLARDVAAGSVPLQTVSAATDAAVLRHALAGAGAPRDGGALVPAMAQRVRVVGDEAGAAAVADMGGMAARLAGVRGGMGIKAVGQRRGDVLMVAIHTCQFVYCIIIPLLFCPF